MNFFEYIYKYFVLIYSGPLGLTTLYGNFVRFLGLAALILLPTTYSIFAVTLGLGILALALSYYQLQSQSIVTNGRFGELDQQTCDEIDALAKKYAMIVGKKALVTNFTTLSVIPGRFPHNAEIYISHHWFENEETRKNLAPILEWVIIGIKNNCEFKKICISSFIDNVILLGILALKPWAATFSPYGVYALFIPYHVGSACLNYILAAYSRHCIFQADLLTARSLSPEALKQALTFLDPQFTYDKTVNTGALPNWKLTTPRTADRIARLDALEQKQS